MDEKEKPKISEMRIFVDEKGRCIEMRVPLYNGNSDNAEFFGKGMFKVETQQGAQQVGMEFLIEAGNIEEAFERLESAAEKAAPDIQEKIMAQIAGPRIVRAGGGPLPPDLVN